MNMPTPKASDTVNYDLNETYPGYMVDSHAQMLVGSLAGVSGQPALTSNDDGATPYNTMTFIESAVDNNPYLLAEAADPADAIEYADSAIDDFETLVDTYISAAPDTDGEQQALDDFIAKASALYTSYGANPDDAAIESEVTAFDQDSEGQYLRHRNEFEGLMFQINSVENNTPYLTGLALIAGERTRSLDRLRANLRMQTGRDKNVFIVQLAQLMLNAQGRNAGLQQALAAMRQEHARFDYVSNREQRQQDIEYDVGEVEWELEILKSGISAIGAMQGIPTMPKKPSNLATAISTALSVGPQVGMSVSQATNNPLLGMIAGAGAAAFSYDTHARGVF